MTHSDTSTEPSTLALNAVLPQLESALEHLQEVWLLSRGYRDPERASAVTEAIGDALGPVFRIYTLAEDPVELTHLAQRGLDGLLERLHSVADAPWFDHVQQLVSLCGKDVTEADTRLRRSLVVNPEPIRLTASGSSPALQRGPTKPLLPKAINMQAAEVHGELGAQPLPTPNGFSKDPLPALTSRQWVEFHARDCFGDVIALLPQRVTQLGEMWSLADVIERRLSANLDAIAALGDDGYQAVETVCQTAVVVDEALCSGLALLAGAVASRDLLALCERLMLTWETDVSMWKAVADTWKLSRNPWLGAVCDRYLQSPDVRKQALAVEVLGYRSWLTEKDVARLLREEKLPRASLLPHLSALPLQERHDWLRRLYGNSVSPVGDPDLWWASALSAYPPTLDILEQAALTDTTGQAWLLLALYGERAHADSLLELFTQHPTPILATAVGWTGLGRAIPSLIAGLTSEDPALENAIAAALERITGAGLFEEITVTPEHAMDPDVPEPNLDGPNSSLESEFNDPRDPAPEGSPDTVILPAVSEEIWRQYWTENAERFSGELRYRCGLPASPEVLVNELEHALRTPLDRRYIHYELMMRTGQRVQFDPHQWVSEQHAALDEWRQVARRCSTRPGTWFRLPVAY